MASLAACRAELAAIALDFHELALKQSSLKVRQLYMRRRLRRLELAALKAEFGEEPGTEAAVETELEEGEEGGEPAAAAAETAEPAVAVPANMLHNGVSLHHIRPALAHRVAMFWV